MNTSSREEEDCCAICLTGLCVRQRKLHTTECGHVFHEGCFEKIKGELTCPCCRAEVQPVLKQQIREMSKSIKDMAEYVRTFPLIQQQYIEIQNKKIAELENQLREAKMRKRTVSIELSDSNRHNKQVLDRFKAKKKLLLEKLNREMVEYKNKKAEMRASTKAMKIAKNPKVKAQMKVPNVVEKMDGNRIVEA